MIDIKRFFLLLERGDVDGFLAVVPDMLKDHKNLVRNAVFGSMDSAVQLLDALVPDWDWSVTSHGQATLWPPVSSEEVDPLSIDADIGWHPAQALLLCILRALDHEEVRTCSAVSNALRSLSNAAEHDDVPQWKIDELNELIRAQYGVGAKKFKVISCPTIGE